MTRQNGDLGQRVLRIGLGVFLVLTCLKVWLGPVTMVPTAEAQIPNAGNQRLQLVNEVRKSNELLTQIAATLKSQTLKVAIQGTDNKGVGSRRAPSGRRP